jgi:NAD(P)H dehydrogenase (quinone)
MIVVTGASGQLGRLVVKELLKSVQPDEVIAAVRSPDKVSDFAELGVKIRSMDYTKPDTLDSAFAGADKVLLISSSEVGSRTVQHANVINACKNAGVKLLAYTSILHADSTPLPLAEEHKQTEALLAQSGVPHVLLRNGWYTENYTAAIPVALEYGQVMGCAGEGKISSAARADYAIAAARVLSSGEQAGKVYELAGDSAYTLNDLAAEIARQSGKDIVYQNLPEEEYFGVLKSAGLPEPIAMLLAESDTGASKGGLFDDSATLSRLIGRPTTPLSQSVSEVLASI